MILTQMPDLPPRPETPRNAAFRRDFYGRWGKENSIVCGSARHAEYTTYRQTLSIKTVQRGREHYHVDRRRLTVSDETWLILNENREYSSVLEGHEGAFSFCIFFRPGMGAQIAEAVRQDYSRALDQGAEPSSAPIEFAENLRPHDKSVASVLRYIRRHVACGVDDPNWYEEQFNFLLGRVVRAEQTLGHLPERLEQVHKTKRQELVRRLGWATDFMHSNLDRGISLGDIAQAARLSRYHFLRVFRQLHGVTPMTYLRNQRTVRALALLHSTRLDIGEVASQVGLSRVSLWRAVQKTTGQAPKSARNPLDRASPEELPRLDESTRVSQRSVTQQCPRRG